MNKATKKRTRKPRKQAGEDINNGFGMLLASISRELREETHSTNLIQEEEKKSDGTDSDVDESGV